MRINSSANQLTWDDNMVMLFFDGIPFTGTVYSDFDNGQLESEEEYVEGMQHGSTRRWHANGAIAVEEYWSNGGAEGRCRQWHPNGNLKLDELSESGFLLAGTHFDEAGEIIKHWEIDWDSPSGRHVLRKRTTTMI